MASPFEALSILLLAASMLVMAGSTDLVEPPPSGYRSELVHVDAKGGFTRHELIRRAVHRSKLRAQALSLASDATAASVIMKYSLKDSEYHMKLSIDGSPSVSVIADTGSDLTWVPAEHCHGCPTTASDMGCDQCRELMKDNSVKCPYTDSKCLYTREYGEGSKAKGYLVKGKLSTGPSDHDLKIDCATPAAAGLIPSKDRLYIGCTKNFDCAPKTPKEDCKSYEDSGVAGLGRGTASVVRQLGFGKFSYCLTDYLNTELNSPIMFGRLASPPKKATTTNLVVKGEYPSSSKYFVKMTKISMQGEDQIINMPGDGDMFIDSGMSFTHLPEEAFREVKMKVDHLIMKEDLTGKQSPKNDPFTCYNGAKLPKNMPEMVLHLDGAEMHLPVESYMFVDEKSEEVCLAMLQQPGKDKTAILGNFQQQNLSMHFDITDHPGKLSFARVDCGTVL